MPSYLDNIDFQYDEECKGNELGRPPIIPGTMAWQMATNMGQRPISLNDQTQDHFTREVLDEATRLNLQLNLAQAYVAVITPDTRIQRRNGIITATYRTISIQDGQVQTHQRTVRCGLCHKCFRAGPVGLDCCRRAIPARGVLVYSKFENTIFNETTNVRGDPIHVAKIFGQDFNPPRDETKYHQYDGNRPDIFLSPLYMMTRMVNYQSEIFLIEEQACMNENMRNAFGWTEAETRAAFQAFGDEDEAEEAKEAA